MIVLEGMHLEGVTEKRGCGLLQKERFPTSIWFGRCNPDSGIDRLKDG
jgi:hypothetical protein